MPGFFIALIILRGAWRILSESIDILLESTPKDIDVDKVAAVIKSRVSGIKDLHDLHVWAITSGVRAFSAHILIEDTLLSKCGEVSKEIKEILNKEFNISHPTLEFECESCEGPIICPIDKKE